MGRQIAGTILFVLVFLSLASAVSAQSWWDGRWNFRVPITIVNNHPTAVLEKGYTITFSVDLPQLVAEGKVLPDARDLRVVYQVTHEIDRVNETLDGTPPDSFSFKLQEDIPAGGLSEFEYIAYYGNPAAGSAPQDKDNIYLFQDDFTGPDGASPNISKWQVQGNVKIQNNQLHIVGGSGWGSSAIKSLRKVSRAGATGIFMTSKVSKLEPQAAGVALHYGQALSPPFDGVLVNLHDDGMYILENNRNVASAPNQVGLFQTYILLGGNAKGSQVEVTRDGFPVLSWLNPNWGDDNLPISVQEANNGRLFIADDIIVKKRLLPEPNVTVLQEQRWSDGGAPYLYSAYPVNGSHLPSLVGNFGVSILEGGLLPGSAQVHYYVSGAPNLLRSTVLSCTGIPPLYACGATIDLASMGVKDNDVISYYFTAQDSNFSTGTLGSAGNALKATFDLTYPAVTILFPPPNAFFNSTSVQFFAGVRERNPASARVVSGNSSCDLVNASGIWGCTAVLPDGFHQARFIISDRAGNVNDSEVVGFLVDAVPPSISIEFPTPGDHSSSILDFNMTASELLSSAYAVLDNVTFISLQNDTLLHYFSYGQSHPQLLDGNHVLEFFAFDRLLKNGRSQVSFRVLDAPDISPLPNVSIPEDSGFHDNLIYLPDFVIDNGVPATQLQYNISFFARSGNTSLQENLTKCVLDAELYVDCFTVAKDFFGERDYRVFATDPGGLRGNATFILNVTPVNDPPSLENLPDQVLLEDSGLNGNLVNLSAFVIDPDSQPSDFVFTIIYQSEPDIVDCSPNLGKFLDCQTKPDQNGFSLVVVQVSDGEFTDDDVFFVVVLPVNDPPAITSVPPLKAHAGTPYTYDVAAQDPENTSLTYSLLEYPSGMTIHPATGLVDWLPSAGPPVTPSSGKNTLGYPVNVTVQVSDGQLQDIQPYTLFVSLARTI